MRTEEEIESSEDLGLGEFLLPVKHNIGMLKKVAKTRKEKRAVQTMEWFFCFGPPPKQTLIGRIRILPWALLDRFAVFRAWVLNEEE